MNNISSSDSSTNSENSPRTAIATTSASSLIAAADIAGASLSVPMPFQCKITLAENVRIAGTAHIPNIDSIASNLEIGAELKLEREPNNLADTWAIKVLSGDVQIGYVSADCNEIFARLMDGGKKLLGTLTSKEKVSVWNKLCMEVILDD